MTREENIKAILDTCFSESKDEIKEIALKNIMSLSDDEYVPNKACFDCMERGTGMCKGTIQEQSWCPHVAKTNAEAEWIPVSERLPDIDTPVIICTASGGITDGYRWNEKDWFLAWGEYNGWHEGNDGGRIIAWMPLPTPYGERREP